MGLFVYRNVTINGLHKQLLVVPVSLVPLILQQLHDFAGHKGIEWTTALVCERFYWPSVLSDVRNYCKNCRRCTIAKEPRPKVKTKMSHLISKSPLEIISMDFTLLDKSSSGLENVLVLVGTVRTVAKVLIRAFFNRYGFPKRIHSDTGMV